MHTTLIVIYTERLDDCHAFYRGLGLEFAKEQHGAGPEHYAATLQDGAVIELYPAGKRGATGYLRLGLRARAGVTTAHLPAGRHTLRDPDGRAIDIEITDTEATLNEQDIRTQVVAALGESAEVTVTAFPGDRYAITVRTGGHAVTIDGSEQAGWGWSLDPGDDEAFIGHASQSATLEEALRGIRSELAKTA